MFLAFTFIGFLYHCTSPLSSPDAFTKGEDVDWRKATNWSPLKDQEYFIQEELAKQHCSSCHEYVPPEMLDRITWPRVLSLFSQ